MAVFYPDTPNLLPKTNEHSNDGLKIRCQIARLIEEMDMVGRLHS